jgi:hypothetical protein
MLVRHGLQVQRSQNTYLLRQFVIGFKPSNKLLHINICEGCWHITGLHRHFILLGFFARSIFNRFDKGHQLNRVVISYVK